MRFTPHTTAVEEAAKMTSLDAAIAATRFGLGAQVGELREIGDDPRGWLEAQLLSADKARISQPHLKSSDEIGAATLANLRKLRIDRRAGESDVKEQRMAMRDALVTELVKEVSARNTHAIETKYGFLERWVRFWSNHFTVSTRKFEVRGFAGAFEREAIRENAFGTFSELLQASVLHSGMLIYLDNHRSVGPGTFVAWRRDRGLNENLAREVLELHTLGVDGGYTQEDVIELAKALTGWTIAAPPFPPHMHGKRVFVPRIHEPGSKTVLGKKYKTDGEEQAREILKDLAVHPSTIMHVAFKLAQHFVADSPPASAVDKIAAAFRETGGDLKALARTIVRLDEAWNPEPRKLKTPDDLLVSAARALGGYAVYGGVRDLRKIYTSLGQVPFGAPSPDGWSDKADDWVGPDAIKKRLEWANRAAQRGQSRLGAEVFLEEALGVLAGTDTRRVISRAESNAQGLTLALMSPEFQRR